MAKPTGIGKDIVALRLKGLKYDQIVNQLGCAKSTVSYHCAKHGLSDIGYLKCVVGEDIQKKIKEYTKTHSIKDASVRFMLSESTIKKYKH